MSFRDAQTSAGGLGGEAADDEAFSLIDRHTTVDGSLETDRDLRVDGKVLGTLTCGGVLFVAEGAEIDAEVEAGAVVVSGSLSGTIVCRGRLEIRDTGMVRGSVQTGTLVILEGAVYEGQLRMEPPPAPEEPAAAEPAAEPTLVPDEQPNAYSFLRRFTTTTAAEPDEPDDEDHATDAGLERG